ncbi:hypothetical protein NW762_011858 [Fusarium torreyae]|uniref:RFX-type winged-helix domain-containing protein n=1 Tax=Fusarium torreyae TaxID=1237075 RepID=A0A9W8RNS0_9HYPO|nr:hypothetical protein NW762_011858 [Fusarium torreyae]
MYSGQWITNEHAHAHAHAQAQAHAHNHGHPKDMGAPQMTAEELMLQAAQQLQAGHDFSSMDASMTAPMGHHPMQYQQKQPMQRHPLPAEQYSNNASYTEGDGQMMDREENDEGESVLSMPKPTTARSSANNELEMRQLFGANRHRNLQDVASELHGNERGPNSERTRQVFAMLWINSVCSKGKGSVPRGRVYANYASRCATERITVLNPASFGKLVRVLFPGLKTRRLGVRGESKYHYVNFTLVDDQPEVREPSVQPTRPLTEAAGFTQGFNTVPTQSSINLSQGALPSPYIGTEVKPAPAPRQSRMQSHSLYNQPVIARIDYLNSTTTKTQLDLAFPPEVEDNVELSDPLPLPHIESYLPQGTDPDAAKSLSALYRSHYTLRSISERLIPHIRESFQGQPQHVIRAKEAPATLFAGLLDRSLRVNLTAHAAANMLANPANRDQMYIDWITMIRARKVAECIPTRGMDDVVNVLLNDMRDLLDPVKVPWEVECVTIYGDVVTRSGRPLDSDGSASASGQNVLDRWVGFLRGLPAKFPYASHSEIVWCVERVGTAVMRDITLTGGKSFGSWWVTKTWVDEMVCFLAEQGGFMKQKSSHTTGATTSTPPQAAKDTSRQTSRYSSGSDELNLNNTSQNQGERAPFPPANKVNQNSTSMSGGDVNDDSGIGIRTPEEDFPIDKFGFTVSEGHDSLLTGSDLAGL